LTHREMRPDHHLFVLNTYADTFYLVYFFSHYLLFFFFNDTAPTEIYTLSLHDALPIFRRIRAQRLERRVRFDTAHDAHAGPRARSEEHTSELQSQSNLVCRLLLEKKKKKTMKKTDTDITNYRRLACMHDARTTCD